MREEMYAPTHEPAHFHLFLFIPASNSPIRTGRRLRVYDGAQHSVDSGMHY
jgi:hypothetical protein